MLPPVEDSTSEDPTSQIPWPARRHQQSQFNFAGRNEAGNVPVQENVAKDPSNDLLKTTKRKLSEWQLITLSISMLGAQIVWTVELGYGTPFLLSLGLSEQLTSLVWLAGPISGLIAQPVIGAISDSSPSKYRRRYWIVTSTAVLVISTFVLAYCKELAAFFVDLLGVGAGDWDEARNKQLINTAIGFAIVAFYLLDFALNALQASLRNLLLDITPTRQLNSGNAWHGRMTHAGNIIGFGFGFLPLDSIPFIRDIGGTQFRKFCVISIILLAITVWMTCASHEEEERPARTNSNSRDNKFREVLDNIQTAITSLPRPIRRVCYVQFFAFMGWFPFLFYSTTYMGQVMAYEQDKEPDPDYATRTGARAMLFYSIVAVVAGTVLPHFANRDRRLMAHKSDVDEDAELERLRETVRQWRIEAAQKGKPLRLPVMPFLLRNIWTGALVLFSLLTFSTFFVKTVTQATVFIALVGICWSVAMWVPFAIIMELLKELSPRPGSPPTGRRVSHTRATSSPGVPRRSSPNEQRPNERSSLLRRRSLSEYDVTADEIPPEKPLAGGTILGVHNLAIVAPQLVVAIATSIIFKIVDGSHIETTRAGVPESTYYGKNGVAWVLRFGGLCTLIGAVFARRVAPTPTEKSMRRRLGEMEVLREEEPSV